MKSRCWHLRGSVLLWLFSTGNESSIEIRMISLREVVLRRNVVCRVDHQASS